MAPDDELRKKARKIAKEKSDFYIHFVIYIAVNLLLIAIWWVTLGPYGFPWFVFPLFGWGIGVAAHGISAFRGEGYIEQQAEKEYQKLKKKDR
ncbi:MAG: 2TM domain-containing protein [Candidatus Thermoplasmatota archaeon]|nr:2TM domain-containing protein [Candidatus Thermoplasmatota archaeon]